MATRLELLEEYYAKTKGVVGGFTVLTIEQQIETTQKYKPESKKMAACRAIGREWEKTSWLNLHILLKQHGFVYNALGGGKTSEPDDLLREFGEKPSIEEAAKAYVAEEELRNGQGYAVYLVLKEAVQRGS